ncbi:MAG TPA: toxin HicA [Mycobacterium sp.]|nr:toxin HicA [Mycobacterium sp.]
MAQVDRIVAAMQSNPVGVRYADLMKVCFHYFGKPRQQGSSHAVFKTPWPGDPRVNIQSEKGKAKAYQVRQVLRAIAKLEDEQ